MEDLDGHQFTFVEATGNVYAIDAPEPLATSPIYDVLDWLTKRGGRGENSAAACAAGQDQQSCVWSAWCVSRVPFSGLRDPKRPTVSRLSPLRSRPRHRRAVVSVAAFAPWRHVIDAQHVTPAALPLEDP